MLHQVESNLSSNPSSNPSNPSSNPDNSTAIECSICLEPLNGDRQDIARTTCGHEFHTECLMRCYRYPHIQIVRPAQSYTRTASSTVSSPPRHQIITFHRSPTSSRTTTGPTGPTPTRTTGLPADTTPIDARGRTSDSDIQDQDHNGDYAIQIETVSCPMCREILSSSTTRRRITIPAYRDYLSRTLDILNRTPGRSFFSQLRHPVSIMFMIQVVSLALAVGAIIVYVTLALSSETYPSSESRQISMDSFL